MSIVVSDTSPLRALAHLGHVEWLQILFQRVLLPPAVAFELRHPPAAYRPIDVSDWAFLEVLAPTNAGRVAELRSSLDVGEAEAIALAEETEADVVLIDEMAGRETARICGFTVLGTLGLLVRAKQSALHPTVAPLLDRLRNELNFFSSMVFFSFVSSSSEDRRRCRWPCATGTSPSCKTATPTGMGRSASRTPSA